MIALLLCIVSSTLIMVVFKLLDRYSIDTFGAIVINYITAAILGFSLTGKLPDPAALSAEPWIPMAAVIGFLFVIMFFVVAMTTQKIGITVTSVASKMSVIMPVGLSILFFNEPVTPLKIIGIALAFPSVILASIRDERAPFRSTLFFLPIILFLGAGFIDSLVKFTQETYLHNSDHSLFFSATLFAFSAITGLLISIFKKKVKVDYKLILGGMALGLANFGSLYFIIEALNSGVFGSSVIFGMNHIGIVSLGAVTGFLVFREKLQRVNWIGLALSLITLFILYQT